VFQEKAIVRLFPTHVWMHDLAPEAYQPLNAALSVAVDDLISPRPQLGPGEIWQTDQNLHKLPPFEPLMGYVQAAVEGALSFLKIRYEAFQVTGCWANIGPPGTAHPGHSHPNNYLSGVYYVKVEKGADSITFNDPRSQTGIMAPHVKTVDQANAVQAHLPAKEGRLLLFPSWFVHSVDVNRSAGERMSISFNIMFTDYAEKMAHPIWRSRFAGPEGEREGEG
jgi:uncharacterized protein (TIGR02466 family)